MFQTLEDNTCQPTYQECFDGHYNDITALSFHPITCQLISSSMDKSVILWQLKSQMPAYKFLGHKEGVFDVCYSPSGNFMVSASEDRYVRIWTPKIKGNSISLKAHSSAVRSVQFNPNEEEFVTASNDKSIKLWLLRRKRFLMSFKEHTSWVRCVKFSPDGKLLISCSDDKTIKVWDVINRQCVKTFNEIKAPARYVEFHPNGIAIGSANEDACIKLYDLRTKSLYQHYAAHKGPVNMIKFHPSGNFMLTASDDSTMKILDVQEGRPIYTLKGHRSSITAITFSKDGEFFASGGMDRRILLWKSNLCMDQSRKIPTRLPSTIKPDNMDEKSSSVEYKEDIHKKQNQKKHSLDTLEKLHLNSYKSFKVSPPMKKVKSEMDRRILPWKSNLCMDQSRKIPTRLPSPIKPDNMDEKSSSVEYKEDIHKKQNQKKHSLEKLHLNSYKSFKVSPPMKKVKSEMVNTEPFERNCAANVLVPQNQTSLDESFSSQSTDKIIKELCSQVQSLYHIVNTLEQRLTMLEKSLRKYLLSL